MSDSTSALTLAVEVQKRAVLRNDLASEFKAMQTEANLHCLNGDITLGSDIAKRMYEKAKESSHPLGIALSVQTMGAVYMNAGQLDQAQETLAEAEVHLLAVDDPLSRLQLYIQQLHTSMKRVDTTGVNDRIAKAETLLPRVDLLVRDDYLFYLKCYQSIFLCFVNSLEQAKEQLNEVLLLKKDEPGFARWHYDVQQYYFKQTQEYEQALLFCDSAENLFLKRKNAQEYKSALLRKAHLLELLNKDKEAVEVYSRVSVLSDSLDALQYTNQINALRIDYQVDQISIEAAQDKSRFLLIVLCYGLLAAVVTLLLIFLVHKRNKRLIESRARLSKMKEVASDSIRSKSMFLSNMSHDLRTPLNAIVGFSQLLTEPDDMLDAEIKQQCRDSIKQNSDLLMKLINDIVDLSNLNEGTIKFEFAPCNVVALCSNVIETVRNVKQTEADLLFTTDVEFLEIETDSVRLQQVLINLLVNATKFTSKGYIKLLLNLDKEANEVVFTVEDTGCGIPLEKQAKIFERFEKLHNAVQGVGLGLSICRLIVGHVKGRIWIDSEYTTGTRFVFTHPLRRNTGTK